MRHAHKSAIFGALLLLIASTDAPAYHGGPSVVRPLHGFSFSYGYPVIHRYSYHYLPKHDYGPDFGYGLWHDLPYTRSFYGHYNDHRLYYYRHHFARPYGRGSFLFFRYYDR